MLNGVTALLEAIDQKVEAIAEEHDRAEAERTVAPSTHPDRPVHVHDGDGPSHGRQTHSFASLPHIAVARHRLSTAAPAPSAGHGLSSSLASAASTPSHADRASLQPAPRPELSSTTTGPTPGRVAGLSSSPEGLRLQCVSLQQAVTSLEDRLAAAEAALEARTGEEVTLRERLTAVEGERATWQRRATYFEETATHARDELARREGESQGLRQAADGAAAALEAYRSSTRELLESREAEVRSLRAQLAAATAVPPASDGASDESPAGGAAAAELRELRALVSRLEEERQAGEAERAQLHRAVAAAERARAEAQQRERALEGRLDLLTLEVRGQAEALEGEAVARAELEAQLRQSRARPALSTGGGGHPGKDFAWGEGREPVAEGTAAADVDGSGSAVAVARLEEALSEAQQRCQVLSFQLVERGTALEANSREVAEWRARYNALARRIGDEEVAAAAGYGSGYGLGSLSFPKPPSAVRGSGGGPASNTHLLSRSGPGVDAGEFMLSVSGGGGGGAGGVGELKRAPSMVQLAARHGRAGRAVVELMARMDEAALRLAQSLRQRPVTRVAVVGYVCLLQLWVVLLFAVNFFVLGGSEGP